MIFWFSGRTPMERPVCIPGNPLESGCIRASDREPEMKTMTSKLILPPGSLKCARRQFPVCAIHALNLPSARARSGRVIIRRLSERRALLKIIQSTFNDYVTEPERLRNQFLVSRDVASRVAVKGISYPRTLRALWSARDAILAAPAHV